SFIERIPFPWLQQLYRRLPKNKVPLLNGEVLQWNAHYDERCFLPIHVYDEATGAPVTVILHLP
ncbi:MAG: hypothetical protein ACLPTQ_08065, partial [Terriglobales bacterium]